MQFSEKQPATSPGTVELMLDHEYDLLIERLNTVRGTAKRFFRVCRHRSSQEFQGMPAVSFQAVVSQAGAYSLSGT
jgi:hypothetical protein